MEKSAILLIVFNRPDLTRTVLEALQQLKPKQLFIAMDAPRVGRIDDESQCKKVREIIDMSHFECEVKYDFALKNLGCKERIITAIDWAFEYTEQLIILEDDCVPTPTFYSFCNAMLSKYADNEEIFSISGSCFTTDSIPSGHVLSDYSLMWGWATWKNRWANYRRDVFDFRKIILRKYIFKPIDFLYWYKIFSKIKRGALESVWDYQWILSLWRNNASCVRPTVLLVRNIGFGADATHTKSDDRFGHIQVYEGPVDNLIEKSDDKLVTRRVNDADRRVWALINIRSVILMWLPIVNKIRRKR